MRTTPQVQHRGICAPVVLAMNVRSFPIFLPSLPPSLTARWITYAQRQWYLGATTLIGEGVL
jgi:hypothetical protein